MSLNDRARSVLDIFQNEKLLCKPTIFITHSFGGLVIKQVWHLVIDRNLPHADQLGVIFIATPHHGTDLADFARSLAKILPYRPGKVLADLQWDSDFSEELQEWYRAHPMAFNQAFYETQTIKGVKVVDRVSANPYVQNVVPAPITAYARRHFSAKESGSPNCSVRDTAYQQLH